MPNRLIMDIDENARGNLETINECDYFTFLPGSDSTCAITEVSTYSYVLHSKMFFNCMY